VSTARPGSNTGFGTIAEIIKAIELRINLLMKPSKKQSTSKVIPSVNTIEALVGDLNKFASGNKSKLPKQHDLGEIFVIPAYDIPPEDLNKLIKKGMLIKPKDDLVNRLLKLEKENKHFQSLSITDSLTGMYNKRFFHKQLKIEVTRTKRTGEPFCLMIIDLDNFKSINDNLGHAKGDEFLIKVCRQINQKTRPTDFACRYGGDEFTAILPGTSLLDGILLAERWKELVLKAAQQMKVNVSASIGIDEYNANCQQSAEDFFIKVDQELYSAKKTGKNRVSHPGLASRSIAEEKLVTPTEKDSLYMANNRM
jgi:diguanylate cyclase (GGDEF)-like protein